MRRIFAVCGLSVMGVFFSCSGAKSDPKAEFYPIIRPYVEYVMSPDDGNNEGIVVNDIEIIRIDTLTVKADSIHTFLILQDLKVEGEEKMELSKKTFDLSKEQLDLAKSMGSKELYNLSYKDVKKYSEAYLSVIDDHRKILARMLRVDSLIRSNELDSVLPTGYQVVLNIKATDKNNTVNDVDSVSVLLSLDKRVRDRFKIVEKIAKGEKAY